MPDLPRLLPDFKLFQLAYVALRLGIPAALAGGRKTLAELASETRVPEVRLLRLLRGLVWAEILAMDSARGFTLTDAGRALLDTSPHSLADGILFQGRFFYSAWGHLLDYLVDGSVPFERAHGTRLFDLIRDSPELADAFNRPMTDGTAAYSAVIAALPALDGCSKIVDIGGCEGRLLLDILKLRKDSTGIIFDLPSVKGAAERMIRDASIEERCLFQSGDMFTSIPSGGDAYILKWMLHDWDDTNALRLLKNVRAQASPGTRLLVIERLMPDPADGSALLIQADLNMLCMNGGAERTERQYSELLAKAGFKLRSVSPVETNWGFFALVAEPL